jgi:hypothetical protein
MTNERLESIRCRLSAITPGPWWVVQFNDETACIMSEHVSITEQSGMGELDIDNANFIANAPIDIELLLAEVDRLKKLNKENI